MSVFVANLLCSNKYTGLFISAPHGSHFCSLTRGRCGLAMVSRTGLMHWQPGTDLHRIGFVLPGSAAEILLDAEHEKGQTVWSWGPTDDQ